MNYSFNRFSLCVAVTIAFLSSLFEPDKQRVIFFNFLYRMASFILLTYSQGVLVRDDNRHDELLLMKWIVSLCCTRDSLSSHWRSVFQGKVHCPLPQVEDIQLLSMSVSQIYFSTGLKECFSIPVVFAFVDVIYCVGNLLGKKVVLFKHSEAESWS